MESSYCACLNEPVHSLVGRTLDLSLYVTEFRYRLIDCAQFLDHNELRVIETTHATTFFDTQYATISYVWHGLTSRKDCNAESLGAFVVKGAEGGGQVSLDVLRHACKASLILEAPYIWLDRLCIMQTKRSDKSWQISQMYHIYKHSKVSIILPGGIQRLADLDEETKWMHRGWTLQEVLAPPHAFVLFSWPHNSRRQFPAADWGGPWILEIVEERQSAMVDVLGLLSMGSLAASGASRVEIQEEDMLYVKTFGSSSDDRAAIMSLIQAKSEETPDETRYLAIWRCSFMRTSSRPVDMVFCIMGLFGITLDPHAFHPGDRVGATAALARELLRKGHSAHWLGISFELPPSKQLAFPEFPRTVVQEEAHVQVNGCWRKVRELIKEDDLLDQAPKGAMDDVGYLIFRGKTIGLHLCRSVRCLEHVHLVDNHGYLWIFIDPEYNSNISTTPPEAFAVVVGYDPNAGAIKALLLKEHHQDHFHIESYFTMSGEHYAELTKNWEVREFSVGGTEMRQKLSSRKVLESLKQAQFEINADQPSDTEGTNEPSDRQKSAIQRINDNFADVFNLQEIVPFDPLSNEFQGYWQERMSKETRFRQVLQEGIHEFSGPLSPSLPVPSSEDREDSWEFQDLYDLVQKFSGKLGKQEKDNDGFTISRRLPEFHFESMFAQDDWKDLEDEQAAYSARFERTFESELWTEAGLIETRQSLHQNSALEEAHLNEDCYDTDEI